MDQLSLFPEKRTSVNIKEERLVKMTVDRIMNLKWGLEAVIRETEMKAKKTDGEVRETYLRIIARYKAELNYLDDIMWENKVEVTE